MKPSPFRDGTNFVFQGDIESRLANGESGIKVSSLRDLRESSRSLSHGWRRGLRTCAPSGLIAIRFN